MVALLARFRLVGACLCLSVPAFGADFGERHTWTIDVDLGVPSTSSDLGPWTTGELGKLRFDASDGLGGHRVMADYRGHMTQTLWVRAVLDYVDDASPGVDFTEAYLDWRPLPKSANHHQVRFGAFYPPLSLENGDSGWASPFTTSFSAINTWLGEEIRPVGIEWSLRRRLGFAGSPHELRTFAAAFYGNDPAGTLLFWRGWSLHDRQTRLDDRLEIPPVPVFGPGGVIVGLRDQALEPFEEIDDEPGFYTGVEWRFARRALLQLASYDNRADPWSFRDGQWGWRTEFSQLAAQIDLPGGIGLVSQWMTGEAYWLIATTPTGSTTPATRLVREEFESRFLLLTKQISPLHRLSARYDTFEMTRAASLDIDRGHAWTWAYHYQPTPKLGLALEWLAIDSRRDMHWGYFYGLPAQATERQWRLQLSYRLRNTDAT